jgi:hypothetical protein
MTILMPSTPNFTTSRFYLETNTQTFTSPLTNTTQRLLLGGARWRATYSLPAMKRALAAAWQSFFLLCEGGVNAFNAFDPDKASPRGAGGGTPLVNGGSQTGSSLITDGWPASTVVLKAGDMLSFGELKMATADVLSDGSGNATISFKPAMRSSPADNTPITVLRPTCTMVLSDDSQAVWDCDKNGIYQPKTFTALEVFS